LALIDQTETLRSQIWPLGRDLTAYLHDCLAEFIHPHGWQDLTFLSVSQGPGGFTGTRIGVVVARTLAQQLDIPLFGISSLAAIAQHHYQSQSGKSTDSAPHLAVELRAQREEIFGAIYQQNYSSLKILQPETLYPQTDWEAQLRQWPHPYQLIQAEGGLAHSVSGILSLAYQQWQAGDRPAWQTVLPVYGQHPVQRSTSSS